MTIILFLVDTSSSMCQKAYVNGAQKTYLDIAKGAVETFLKFRQRSQDCLGDRYMLLTFEEPPANVKAGWKENHATFMNELKNLQSTGLTPMNESLKNAFDLLNLNRMQSGIDTYGQGRCPFYLEPSVIIVITDGGRYSYRNGVQQDIVLPLNTQIPGSKFTKEPFRWDQRMFTLVLRMSGNKIDERVDGKVPHDDSPIERMCEVTGGRSYRVRTQFVLNQCIESLVQKIQAGVVLQFEPMLPKDGIINETLQDIVFQSQKKMIYVQKLVNQKSFPIGYWPLPEPYWPDPKAMTLPARDAHPKLKIVTPGLDEPQIVRNFPIDKYEVEAGPLTFQILHKREPNKCWQVIISNGMHGFELPFGYLKANQNFTQVHLYVLAYNYPALLPLLHDLTHKYNMSPPTDLLYKFNSYVRSIPPYYCPFLRKALHSINLPYQLVQFLLPENADNYLSATVANQLKLIKNTAKQDQENLCMKVYKQLKQLKPPYRQIETSKLHTGVQLRKDLVRHPLLRETFAKFHAEIEPIEVYNFVVPQIMRQTSAKSYRNPFDIPRRDLIDDISRMRETFSRPTSISFVAKDSGHCLPIAEMGNYQEYLKNKENPLREIEPTNVRQHMFGNPYKKDKHMVMVDEADLSDVTPMKSNNVARSASGSPVNEITGLHIPKKAEPPRDRSRKVGPISKDFIFRRTSTDSRPSSPCPSITSIGSGGSSSVSDFDEASSMSVSSDMSDDCDNDRLVVVFDFNEDEPAEPDFPAINGYVRNFINGNDESSTEVEMNVPTYGIPGGGGVIVSNNATTSTTLASSTNTNTVNTVNLPTNNSLNALQQANTTAMTQPQSLSNYAPDAITPPIIAAYNNNNVAIGSTVTAAYAAASTHLQSQTQTPLQQFNGNSFQALQTVTAQAVQAVGAPLTASTPMYYQHNDINDAQEISRILQQCHNGSSTIATTSSSVDNTSAITKVDTPATLMPPPSLNAVTAVSLSNNFDSLKRETQSTGSTFHNSNSTSNHVNSNSISLQKNSIPKLQAFTEEQKENARKHNLDLRLKVFRDIRRPGRNYAQLLENLSLIKGDYDMKSNFVQMCITESLRFRRKQMVNSIQTWWDRYKQTLPFQS